MRGSTVSGCSTALSKQGPGHHACKLRACRAGCMRHPVRISPWCAVSGWPHPPLTDFGELLVVALVVDVVKIPVGRTQAWAGIREGGHARRSCQAHARSLPIHVAKCRCGHRH